MVQVAVQKIVANASKDCVIAIIAADRVIAGISAQNIRIGVANDRVIACAAQSIFDDRTLGNRHVADKAANI